MLHAMHYFMSRVITFTEASAEKAVERLQKPQKLRFAQTLTSTLLNLQIKQAMQCLLQETTSSVLEGLDQIMQRPRTEATWVDTFCIVLILCICMEAVQVASDSFAMAALRKDPTSKWDRIVIFQKLDNEAFRQLIYLFHLAYKTPKTKKKGGLGINPIRNGLQVNQDGGITPQMVNLVNDINQILAVHGKDSTNVSWQG